MTDVLPPTTDGLRRAAELLADGAVIAFPTDTVYGVGVASSHPDRIEALYALKARPVDKRIAMLVADLEQVVAAGWNPDDRALSPRRALLAGWADPGHRRADGRDPGVPGPGPRAGDRAHPPQRADLCDVGQPVIRARHHVRR